ncbi:MAG: hypothetical protein V1905_01795 [bacterium]
MRVLVAYYSHTGYTEKLAFSIKKEFELQGHRVDMERILALKERSVWGWFVWRIFAGDAEIISPRIIDAESYDLICVGSPNWTRIALPVSRYLKTIKKLAYKKVGLFSTTALPPAIEWYIFSAYSLESTFSRIVEEKKGRPIATLLLSSIFASKGVDSLYGKQLISDFCRQMVSPLISYKNYILLQKNLKETRFLVTVFITGLPVVVFTLVGLLIRHNSVIFDWRFWTVIVSYAALCCSLMRAIQTKKRLNLSRYVVTSTCVVWWTIIISLFPTTIGDIAIYGYLLIVIFSTLFQDSSLILTLGLTIALNVIFVVVLFSPANLFLFRVDIAFLYLCLLISSLISQRMRYQLTAYSDTQDDVETARDSLDIRVRARTKELTDLTTELDEKVKERTSELEEKLETLEKFSKLTVGRELKIIALKEELVQSKSELVQLKSELENIRK